MARLRPQYPPEFRRQMVELVRMGRTPDNLSRKFEPHAQTIEAWVTLRNRTGLRSATERVWGCESPA